jgi:hypothetical protein
MFKIVKVYMVEADSRSHARLELMKARADQAEADYLDAEFIREVEERKPKKPGFMRQPTDEAVKHVAGED